MPLHLPVAILVCMTLADALKFLAAGRPLPGAAACMSMAPGYRREPEFTGAEGSWREAAVLMAPEHLALSLEAARRSIVLLKNDKGLLPLSKDLKRIAVLGELAESQDDPMGSWSCEGEAGSVVSILKGVRAMLELPIPSVMILKSVRAVVCAE